MRSEQVRSVGMGGRAAGAILGVGAFGDTKVPLSSGYMIGKRIAKRSQKPDLCYL